jgi:hypothetical protein
VRARPAPKAWDTDVGEHLGQHGAVVALLPVTTIANGRPLPSTAWWILVVSPPRERRKP